MAAFERRSLERSFENTDIYRGEGARRDDFSLLLAKEEAARLTETLESLEKANKKLRDGMASSSKSGKPPV